MGICVSMQARLQCRLCELLVSVSVCEIFEIEQLVSLFVPDDFHCSLTFGRWIILNQHDYGWTCVRLYVLTSDFPQQCCANKIHIHTQCPDYYAIQPELKNRQKHMISWDRMPFSNLYFFVFFLSLFLKEEKNPKEWLHTQEQ